MSGIAEFRSETINNDNNPNWDAEFAFESSEGLEITLMIYDEDLPPKGDDFLGELTIQIPKGGVAEEMEYPVTGEGGQGTVAVEFFVAEGPLEPRNCKER